MNEIEPLFGALREEYRKWREYGKEQIKRRILELQEKLASEKLSPEKKRIIRGIIEKPGFLRGARKATDAEHRAVIVLNAYLAQIDNPAASIDDPKAQLALRFEGNCLNIVTKGHRRGEQIHVCGNVGHNHQYLLTFPDGFPGTDGFLNFNTASALLNIIDQDFVVEAK